MFTEWPMIVDPEFSLPRSDGAEYPFATCGVMRTNNLYEATPGQIRRLSRMNAFQRLFRRSMSVRPTKTRPYRQGTGVPGSNGDLQQASISDSITIVEGMGKPVS